MKIAQLACAFGRHNVDHSKARKVHGGMVSRCKHCATSMEEITPHHWQVQSIRDAGLGDRMLG